MEDATRILGNLESRQCAAGAVKDCEKNGGKPCACYYQRKPLVDGEYQALITASKGKVIGHSRIWVINNTMKNFPLVKDIGKDDAPKFVAKTEQEQFGHPAYSAFWITGKKVARGTAVCVKGQAGDKMVDPDFRSYFVSNVQFGYGSESDIPANLKKNDIKY